MDIVKVVDINTYRDGGTIELTTRVFEIDDNGMMTFNSITICIDNKTNKVYRGYPSDNDRITDKAIISKLIYEINRHNEEIERQFKFNKQLLKSMKKVHQYEN